MNNDLLARMQSISDALAKMPGMTDPQVLKNMRSSYEEAQKRYDDLYINSEADVNQRISDCQNGLTAINEKYDRCLKTIEIYNEYLNKDTLSPEDELLFRKRVDECKSISEKLSTEKAELEAKLEELQKEALEENKKFEEAKHDAQILYFASSFYSANPQEEIQQLIENYKNGSVDEAYVNEILQNFKVLLNSGLYKADDIKMTMSPEVRKAKLAEIHEAIEAKIAEIMATDEYKNTEAEIKYYEAKAIEEEKAGRTAFAERARRMAANSRETLQYFLHPERASENQLAHELAVLESKERALMSTDRVLESNLFEELDNVVKLTGGEKTTTKNGVVVPTYFPEEYLEALETAKKQKIVAEAAKAKEDIEKQTGVKLTPEDEEQIKKDVVKRAAAMPAIPLPEAKKAESVATKVETKDRTDAPIIPLPAAKNPEVVINDPEETEDFTADDLKPTEALPNSEKVKVKGFKQPEKSKLDKIKDFFRRNWKKVVTTTLLVGALLGIASCNGCNIGKKPTPTPTPRPIHHEEIIVDEDEEDENTFRVGDQKIVITPENPKDEVGRRKGNTAPADPSTPYTEGETVEFEDGVIVDSKGHINIPDGDGGYVAIPVEDAPEAGEDLEEYVKEAVEEFVEDMVPEEREIAKQQHEEIPATPIDELEEKLVDEGMPVEEAQDQVAAAQSALDDAFEVAEDLSNRKGMSVGDIGVVVNKADEYAAEKTPDIEEAEKLVGEFDAVDAQVPSASMEDVVVDSGTEFTSDVAERAFDYMTETGCNYTEALEYVESQGRGL